MDLLFESKGVGVSLAMPCSINTQSIPKITKNKTEKDFKGFEIFIMRYFAFYMIEHIWLMLME